MIGSSSGNNNSSDIPPSSPSQQTNNNNNLLNNAVQTNGSQNSTSPFLNNNSNNRSNNVVQESNASSNKEKNKNIILKKNLFFEGNVTERSALCNDVGAVNTSSVNHDLPLSSNSFIPSFSSLSFSSFSKNKNQQQNKNGTESDDLLESLGEEDVHSNQDDHIFSQDDRMTRDTQNLFQSEDSLTAKRQDKTYSKNFKKVPITNKNNQNKNNDDEMMMMTGTNNNNSNNSPDSLLVSPQTNINNKKKNIDEIFNNFFSGNVNNISFNNQEINNPDTLLPDEEEQQIYDLINATTIMLNQDKLDFTSKRSKALSLEETTTQLKQLKQDDTIVAIMSKVNPVLEEEQQQDLSQSSQQRNRRQSKTRPARWFKGIFVVTLNNNKKLSMQLTSTQADPKVERQDIPQEEEIKFDISKHEYQYWIHSIVKYDEQQFKPQYNMNDEEDRVVYTSKEDDDSNNYIRNEYEFQTAKVLDPSEWQQYNAMKEDASMYALTEEKIYQTLEVTPKGKFLKIIFHLDGEQTTTGAVVEVIDIEENKSNNNVDTIPNTKQRTNMKIFRLKIVNALDTNLLDARNNLITLPNDFDRINFLSIKQVVRPLAKIPNFSQQVPTVPSPSACRFIMYIGTKFATNQNRDASGAAAIVLHDTRTQNKKFDNLIISKYFPYMDTVRTLNLLAMEGAAKIYNKIIPKPKSSRESPTPVLMVFNDANAFNILAKNINIADKNHLSIKTNIKLMTDSYTLYALLDNNDSFNPAELVAKKTLESATTISNTIHGHEIITESQHIISRRNQMTHQQNVVNKAINDNSDHVIDTLKIEEFVERCDFDKFIQLNRFKCRTEIYGSTMRQEWAGLVKMVCCKIKDAQNAERRSFWMRALILLPHMFLPLRTSTTNILQHMVKHEPFNIDWSKQNQHQQQQQNENRNHHQQHQQQNQQTPTNQMEDLQHHLKRTAKRVETLAKDNQLRKAVNFMMQDADQATWNNKNNNLDNEEIHEAKVKNLQSKMLKMEEQNKLEELHHHVTPLNKRLVYETVKKIARGTANGIDAWSRNILFSAMTVDPYRFLKTSVSFSQ